MKMRLLLLIVSVGSLGLAQPSSKLGGQPGSPIRMGFGAEGIGFGNALVAVRSNPMTGYYNPALLPFQENPIAFASVGFLSLDRNLNFVSYSRPVEPSGGISIGLINAGVSDIEGRDSDGRRTSTFSTSENAFLLSFGVRVDQRVSIGISTKILYYHLYTDINSTTVGFDVGMAAIVTEELTLGMSLQDIGSKYKWNTTGLYGVNGNATTDRFPLRKKIGIAYASSSFPLQTSIESEHVSGVFLFRMGAAFQLIPEFVLRAGVDHISLSDNLLPKPAFGFTTTTAIGALTTFLSYTYVIEPYSPGGFHLLALGVEFR